MLWPRLPGTALELGTLEQIDHPVLGLSQRTRFLCGIAADRLYLRVGRRKGFWPVRLVDVIAIAAELAGCTYTELLDRLRAQDPTQSPAAQSGPDLVVRTPYGEPQSLRRRPAAE